MFISDPKTPIEHQLNDHFSSLPPVVQNAITSADIQKELRALANKHKLHIDQWGTLETEVMMTLMGIQDASDLASNLSGGLNISAEESVTLANDINTIVFEPIRQELERQLESPDAKPKELSGAETARQEILAQASSFQVPASTAANTSQLTPRSSPLVGTPPQPPPTEKTPRTPISTSYTSGQSSVTRKAADDPYREPAK